MIGKGKRLHELQPWDVRNLLYVSNKCQRKVITGVNNLIKRRVLARFSRKNGRMSNNRVDADIWSLFVCLSLISCFVINETFKAFVRSEPKYGLCYEHCFFYFPNAYIQRSFKVSQSNSCLHHLLKLSNFQNICVFIWLLPFLMLNGPTEYVGRENTWAGLR